MKHSIKSILIRIIIKFFALLHTKKIIIKNSHLSLRLLKGQIKLSREFPVKIRNSKINQGFQCEEGCLIADSKLSGNIQLSRFVSLNGGIYIAHINSIRVGSFTSIAPNVMFYEAFHRMDKVSTYYTSQNLFKESLSNDIVSKGDIVIEEDVWIGANVVVLSGVKIGRGSVVGAGSVVSKDIPPYSVAVGNPTKVIKKRFPDDIIQQLEESQWWLWSIEKIKAHKKDFNKNLLSEKTPVFQQP